MLLDLRTARVQQELDAKPFHEWVLPDGTLWTRFYCSGKQYLLRFPGLADFTVSANGTKAAAYPMPGVSRATIEHLYLNQIVPLALSRQRKLVLHASAVEVRDRAVAFLGVSGRGKSTLAASFSISGYRFLTDDGLLTDKEGDGYIVHPGHPSIRLWEDSREALIPGGTDAASPVDYTSKARLLADDQVAFCNAARPLCRVYFLGDGNTGRVEIVPLGGRDAMVELVRHSFLLDVEEREMLARHFELLSALVEIPMFFRLDYPRSYAVLPDVRDAVIRQVAELESGVCS
ncbi:MAG: hypothetical protein A3H32_19750 [Betaproteobacteria bacterium RIFCSPLOWO2_02_FULL_63_19]|nr:MAG: hypothetical protein A3H32_19750 [Betaproteobacteria bacterium RIFCSPLOWO2_02_FULL_63_19]